MLAIGSAALLFPWTLQRPHLAPIEHPNSQCVGKRRPSRKFSAVALFLYPWSFPACHTETMSDAHGSLTSPDYVPACWTEHIDNNWQPVRWASEGIDPISAYTTYVTDISSLRLWGRVPTRSVDCRGNRYASFDVHYTVDITRPPLGGSLPVGHPSGPLKTVTDTVPRLHGDGYLPLLL